MKSQQPEQQQSKKSRIDSTINVELTTEQLKEQLARWKLTKSSAVTMAATTVVAGEAGAVAISSGFSQPSVSISNGGQAMQTAENMAQASTAGPQLVYEDDEVSMEEKRATLPRYRYVEVM